MRKTLFAGLITAAFATAPFGSAQQQPAQPLQSHQLTSDIYWVEGGGGNIGIVIGDKGVIVIDTKTTAEQGKEILQDVAKVTSKPVTTVIITHSDIDHVGGLPAFPKGITIIAHENEKKELEAAIAQGGPRAPSPDTLPTQLISKNKEDLTIDGVKIELLHWAPAHTTGDMVVLLPAQKIVFTGDIITMNRARPLIHAEKGGQSAGWLTTAKGIIALDADKFVVGHGGVVGKQDIQQKITEAETERNQIKELVAKGQSLQQIETATGDPSPAEAAGGNGPRFAPYSEVVYNEFTKK